MQTIDVFRWKMRWIIGLCVEVALGVAATPSAETFDPSSADYSGRRGKTIYVSNVDLEDCILMGYRVFGRGSVEANKIAGSGESDPSYSLKGKVSAYVHYRQPVPKGFERLGLWPVDVFSQLAPPLAPPGRR